MSRDDNNPADPWHPDRAPRRGTVVRISGACPLAIDESHRQAMEAKRRIFLAQDAIGRATMAPGYGTSKTMRALVRRIERQLSKVRAELEALDRHVRDAYELGSPLGSAGAR